MQTIVNQSGLPKHRATECLNALVHSKDVVKVNKKVRIYMVIILDELQWNLLIFIKGTIMFIQAGFCTVSVCIGASAIRCEINQIIKPSREPIVNGYVFCSSLISSDSPPAQIF